MMEEHVAGTAALLRGFLGDCSIRKRFWTLTA